MKLGRNICFIFSILFSLNCFAVEVQTKVSYIEVFVSESEPSLIFLASGLVGKVPSTKSALLSQLQSALEKQQVLLITLSEDREITSVEILDELSSSFGDQFNKLFSHNLSTNDTPTLLSSLNEARELFRYARVKHKDSQCYNRAHVWSYEWQMDKSINSAKMFLFFSVKYIRENNFQWWFHVAPYVHVVIGTEIKERIMDKKYMPGPSTLRSWIDRFMEDGTKCRTITSYSHYANYPDSGLCYIMRANMFTYWPLDLELNELRGKTKDYWVPSELHTAYEEAFDIIMGGE
jgi:hypothetical protein